MLHTFAFVPYFIGDVIQRNSVSIVPLHIQQNEKRNQINSIGTFIEDILQQRSRINYNHVWLKL